MMWVYTTPGVAQNVWRTIPGDSTSGAYNTAGNWVGVIFAGYSLFGALFSVVMARLANKFGRKMSVYRGIFNATITTPQITAGILGGVILSLIGGKAILMRGVAGLSMLLDGLSVVFVKEHVLTSKS